MIKVMNQNKPEENYPKKAVCDNCGAELMYDKEDKHLGLVGWEVITCPDCGYQIAVSCSS